MVLRPGRLLLYFFDTNLKPTVSRDAEEKRDRFFFWDSISLRAPQGEKEKKKKKTPFLCATETKAFDRSTETKRSKSARAERGKREREREESEFLLVRACNSK